MAPGLFARHLSPGSAFALWGVYWFVNTIYVVAKRNVRHSLKQTSVLEHLSWRWEARSNFGMAEACVKIFACLSLLVVELAQGGWKPVFEPSADYPGDADEHTNIANYQHATMYLFFATSGVVDLLEEAGYINRKHRVSNVFLGLAFAAEAFLFFGHTNPGGLSARAHQIYGILVVIEAALVFSEMRIKGSLWVAVSKAFILTLSGCWFIQTGAMLYVFDVPNTPESVALCHLFLTWHVFCLIFVFGVVHQTTYAFTTWYVKRTLNGGSLLHKHKYAMVDAADGALPLSDDVAGAGGDTHAKATPAAGGRRKVELSVIRKANHKRSKRRTNGQTRGRAQSDIV